MTTATAKKRRPSFTEQQVLSVRQQAANHVSVAALARAYNCDVAIIVRICNHQTYRQYGGPKITKNAAAQTTIDHNSEIVPDRSQRFSREQILAIRHAAATGDVSFSELGRQYGCSTSMISMICSYTAYYQYGGPKVIRLQGSKNTPPVVTWLSDEDPGTAVPVVLDEANEEMAEEVSSEADTRRACRRCGLLIFNSLEDALSVVSAATRINVAVGYFCTACHDEGMAY